jgi:histone H3/H4
MARPWKACSSCKKPIPVGGEYYTCSVSTCNRVRDTKVFCTVECWDAHVPVMGHRSAWANEQVAPTSLTAPAPAPTAERAAPGRRRVAHADTGQRAREEILVVASRLKDFIRAESDFKTSADVLEVLSDHLRYLALEGIERAREDGRRTVKARDIRRPGR